MRKNNISRTDDFLAIQDSLSDAIVALSETISLAHGDSLNLLKMMPPQSVSLILTDPPYHSTKKSNIVGDTMFKTDDEYLEWMNEFVYQWKRILKPNGTIFCFCASEMAARLEVGFLKEFNVLSQIVWTKPNEPGFDGWKQKMKKESLRQWYAHSERIIFAEPAEEGNMHRSYFGNLLREKRLAAGLSGHQLTEMTGAYGKVNHGGAVSNWETGRNIPSREQYNRICEALLSTRKVSSMPLYEDAIRPFNINSSKEFTDVWTFPSVRPYKGKHPAEKPMEMLEHAIEATTFPGDIVLDCFAGSGNTVFAASKLGRHGVAIEISDDLVRKMAEKIESSPDLRLIRKEKVIYPANQEALPLFVACK